jgi:hypothetical protein
VIGEGITRDIVIPSPVLLFKAALPVASFFGLAVFEERARNEELR